MYLKIKFGLFHSWLNFHSILKSGVYLKDAIFPRLYNPELASQQNIPNSFITIKSPDGFTITISLSYFIQDHDQKNV